MPLTRVPKAPMPPVIPAVLPMLLINASSSADCVTLASSRSLKLLPMLGELSDPVWWGFADLLRGDSPAAAARAACWRGDNGIGRFAGEPRAAAVCGCWERGGGADGALLEDSELVDDAMGGSRPRCLGADVDTDVPGLTLSEVWLRRSTGLVAVLEKPPRRVALGSMSGAEGSGLLPLVAAKGRKAGSSSSSSSCWSWSCCAEWRDCLACCDLLIMAVFR